MMMEKEIKTSGMDNRDDDIKNEKESIEKLFKELRDNKDYGDYDDTQLYKVVHWERYGQTQGVEKLTKNLSRQRSAGEENNSFYGSTLKKTKLEAVALNIRDLCVKKSGVGRNGAAMSIIRELDPYMLAAYALDVVLSSLTRERAVQSVCIAIANRIECGVMAQILSEDAPNIWKGASKRIQSEGNAKRQSYILHHLIKGIVDNRYEDGTRSITTRIKEMVHERAKKASINIWPDELKVQIGSVLLNVIVHTTGIVMKLDGNMHTPDKLVATPHIIDWVSDYIDNMSSLAPEWVPLPIPPRRWSTPFDGGYHTCQMPRYPMVTKASQNFTAEMSEVAEMPAVYNTINAAQETGWRINKAVLSVAKEMWDKRVKIRSLPEEINTNNLPVCPICNKIPTVDERRNNSHACFMHDKEAHQHWKSAAKDIFVESVSNMSRSIEVAYTLTAAEKYKDEEVIYFPYYLDFRGRLYCRVAYLSPQGSGMAKSLLEFSEGKELVSQEAADWLAIHVANSFGHDKLPFAERIRWTRENTDMILAIAADPIEHRAFWANMKAKEAWCALAASFEWAGYIREGLNWVSHIPIAQDGTCSGLQHYASLLRDVGTAQQVNVCPADRPGDVYKAVAERTIEILEGLVSSSEDGQMAMGWLSADIIGRNLTKRSVMTLPYGASLFSAKDYVLGYVLDEAKYRKIGPWETKEELRKACFWLGGKVWQAINDVLTVAPAAMKILQKAAKVMARQQLPLNWVTPSGFMVQQINVAYVARRVKLCLNSGDFVYKSYNSEGPIDQNADWPRAMRVTLQEPTDIIDEAKQASGVAPNFIHSLDSSAMCLTVDSMMQKGIRSYALIHDSFATHACDSALMAKILREEFARMYIEQDPLQSLFSQFKEMLTAIGSDSGTIKVLDKLYQSLPTGDLDISCVKDSLYFFA